MEVHVITQKLTLKTTSPITQPYMLSTHAEFSSFFGTNVQLNGKHKCITVGLCQ